MAYKHYWEWRPFLVHRSELEEKFALAAAEIQTIYESLNERKEFIHQGHISDLMESGVTCDMCSHIGENDPIINENEIRLNGCKYSESAREPFEITIDRPGPSFCNTDKRPYDLLVCCSLLVFTGIFPDYVFSFSSDGEDRQWIIPIVQYATLLNKTPIMYFNKDLKLKL
jgi:hypothetical protein